MRFTFEQFSSMLLPPSLPGRAAIRVGTVAFSGCSNALVGALTLTEPRTGLFPGGGGSWGGGGGDLPARNVELGSELARESVDGEKLLPFISASAVATGTEEPVNTCWPRRKSAPASCGRTCSIRVGFRLGAGAGAWVLGTTMGRVDVVDIATGWAEGGGKRGACVHRARRLVGDAVWRKEVSTRRTRVRNVWFAPGAWKNRPPQPGLQKRP